MAKPHYARVRRLDTAQAAWLAGMVDGEGTVTLVRKHAGENRHLGLFVSSTELQLLAHIRQITAVGKVTSKKTTRPRHRPSYTFAVYNRQALGLLRQIHPFLRGYKKARSALILRDYLRLTPRNGKYTADLARRRQRFVRSVLSITPDNKY